MERAVRMIKTGDFNPHFFDYPTFYMCVQAAVAAFHFVVGAMRGQWVGLACGSLRCRGRRVTP
jgi:hypothetical protein